MQVLLEHVVAPRAASDKEVERAMSGRLAMWTQCASLQLTPMVISPTILSTHALHSFGKSLCAVAYVCARICVRVFLSLTHSHTHTSVCE
jgi:hypothetical protein